MNIKTTSRTATQDPITYEATASVEIEMLVGFRTITKTYHGDEDESRKEVKATAKRMIETDQQYKNLIA